MMEGVVTFGVLLYKAGWLQPTIANPKDLWPTMEVPLTKSHLLRIFRGDAGVLICRSAATS